MTFLFSNIASSDMDSQFNNRMKIRWNVAGTITSINMIEPNDHRVNRPKLDFFKDHSAGAHGQGRSSLVLRHIPILSNYVQTPGSLLRDRHMAVRINFRRIVKAKFYKTKHDRNRLALEVAPDLRAPWVARIRLE